MSSEKSGRFEMVTPVGWMEKIDAWRRDQPDLPSRAEAIRRLVESGLRVSNPAGFASLEQAEFNASVRG